MIRILLADEHLLFRQAICNVLASEQDLEVVAETGHSQDTISLASELQPDVVLLDLALPIENGCQMIEYLLACSPYSRIVIFSISKQEEHVFLALQSGAIGYLTKDVGPTELLTALRRAAQNELYITPTLTTRFLALIRTLTLASQQVEQSKQRPPYLYPSKQPTSRHNHPLSRREQEVLALIRQGQRSREIARKLRISEATVHKHIQHIFEKLNVHNRAEALFLTQHEKMRR